MHTKDRLAEALDQAGLPTMAARARKGYYDDFLSELPLPIITLCKELALTDTAAARALRARVVNGEFDATSEESDAWAESPDGQETFRRLMEGK